MTERLTNGAPQERHWLIIHGIEVSDMYNLADARAMLSNTFTYTGLKIFGGIDIDGIALRLQEAQKWFQEVYPNVDPFKWFFTIRPRSKTIVNPNEDHLSTLKSLLDRGMPESEEADLELLEKYRMKYEHIYGHLEELTDNFSENKINSHSATAQLLLDLCSGKRKWAF